MTLAEIEKETEHLSEEEKVTLIGHLSETLRKPATPEVEQAINVELKRRLKMLETGEAEWLTGDEALAKIEARLREPPPLFIVQTTRTA